MITTISARVLSSPGMLRACFYEDKLYTSLMRTLETQPLDTQGVARFECQAKDVTKQSVTYLVLTILLQKKRSMVSIETAMAVYIQNPPSQPAPKTYIVLERLIPQEFFEAGTGAISGRTYHPVVMMMQDVIHYVSGCIPLGQKVTEIVVITAMVPPKEMSLMAKLIWKPEGKGSGICVGLYDTFERDRKVAEGTALPVVVPPGAHCVAKDKFMTFPTTTLAAFAAAVRLPPVEADMPQLSSDTVLPSGCSAWIPCTIGREPSIALSPPPPAAAARPLSLTMIDTAAIRSRLPNDSSSEMAALINAKFAAFGFGKDADTAATTHPSGPAAAAVRAAAVTSTTGGGATSEAVLKTE